MFLLKRLLTSCVLFAILVFALLLAIGMISSLRGGVNKPAGKDSRAYAVGYEATRRYGAIVFLSALSVPALAAVAISFSEFFPWCRLKPRPPARP